MSKEKQDRLSNIQIMALISSSIIGVLVLTLPRVAVDIAQAGAVLSVLLGGVLAMVFAIVTALLGKRFPNKTIIEYSVSILGKIPGKLLGLFIVGYMVALSGIILRIFADALKILMLEKTPLEFIMVAMLVVVVYLVQNGIGAIAKISESFLPLVTFALLLVIGLNYQSFNLAHLRPMFSDGILTTIKAIPQMMVAYFGFEVLFFTIPFMQKPDKVIPYTAIGLVLPILLYTALVGMTIGVFGVESTQTLIYPTIALARVITFPGGFAERFDIFFVILWILAAFTTIVSFFYMGVLSSTRLLGLKNYRPFIYFLLPAVYLVAILPQNIFQINQFSEILGYMGIGLISIPIPLLLIAWITGKGGKNHVTGK